jgi:protein O-mannosyl-transferase
MVRKGKDVGGWFARFPGSATGQLFAALALTFLAYSNIPWNGFAYDDFSFIVGWDLTRSINNLPQLIGGALPEGHDGVYRPLRSVSYVIAYGLYGLNPSYYHLQAIVVHLICTALVFHVTLSLWSRRDLAFFTAALFGLHPAHVESVAFAAASFDLVGVVFFFASVLLFLKAAKPGIRHFALLVLLGLFGFFTYEITLTLPALLLLCLFFEAKYKVRRMGKISGVALAFAAAAAYLALRFIVLGIGGRGGYVGGDLIQTALLMVKALFMYMKLMVFPVGLSVDHIIPPGVSSIGHTNPQSMVLDQSVFDVDFIGSAAAILAAAALAAYCFRRRPVVSFGILWFFIALAPVSNIIPLGRGTIFAERYLYIPSYGICLVIAEIVTKMWAHQAHRKFLTAAAALALVLAGAATYSRNADWKDEMTLWTKTVETTPQSVLAAHNLGVAYDRAGNASAAMGWYLAAIRINPEFEPPHTFLGIAYGRMGLAGQATDELKHSVRIQPQRPRGHYNLGLAYLLANSTDKAVDEFEATIKLEPSFPGAREQLARAYDVQGTGYAQRGDWASAAESYRKAAAISPGLGQIRYNLGVAYSRSGQYGLAVSELQAAQKMMPPNPAVYNELGVAYAKSGQYVLAEKAFKDALSASPGYSNAQKNLDRLKNAGAGTA